MTSKHDGPRAGSPVKVIQSATPTVLPQAEAEELFQLTEAATTTAFNWANAMAMYGSRSPECEAADKANREAYGALYAWQREHGLRSLVERESK